MPTMPQEIITWYLLPAVRKEMAHQMIKSGMSQRQVAKKLGITDAAVSQYISGKRGGDISLDAGVRKRIAASAKRMAKGADARAEMDAICDYSRRSLAVCKIHKAHGGSRQCNICFRRKR